MAVLGIDFGGSGIKGAIVDVESGKLMSERYRIATPKGGEPKSTAKVVKEICEHFSWVGPAGFGYPGVVRQGIATSAANIRKMGGNEYR